PAILTLPASNQDPTGVSRDTQSIRIVRRTPEDAVPHPWPEQLGTSSHSPHFRRIAPLSIPKKLPRPRSAMSLTIPRLAQPGEEARDKFGRQECMHPRAD